MYSAQSYTGDGATTDYAIPFPYLDPSHVEVTVNAVAASFTFPNSGTVRISPAPASGAAVVVRRDSNRTARLVSFTDSSTVTSDNLNKDATQLLYLVQEAFDQSTTQSYFTTDAAGGRVVNMADPVANSDGATKGWVQTYVQSLTADGNDLLPLDNVWTGLNQFTKKLNIMGATFDGVGVSISDALNLDKTLYVLNITDNTSFTGQAFAGTVRRTTGFASLVGGGFNSQMLGTLNGTSYGVTSEAWKGKSAQGTAIGMQASVVNLNASSTDPYSLRVGIDVPFRNREDGSTQGGNASNSLGIAGDGTGLNHYNANSWAMQFSSQGRSDSGNTYVGWNRGLVLRDNWCDIAKVLDWDSTKNYYPGDYTHYSGHVFEAKEFNTNSSPVLGGNTNWADLGASDERKAIGIDFSGIGSVTASRMLAAIKLRGQMPIMWDTEEQVTTLFDPATGMWSLKNAGVERFGVDVTTGDIHVNGTVFTQGTPSTFSVTRGGTPQVINSNVWTTVGFASVEFDDRAEYDTNTSRFTAQQFGDYQITAQVQSEGGSQSGYRLFAGIAVNGTVVKAGYGAFVSDVNAYNTFISAKLRLNPGDHVTVQALFTGTSTLAITGETTATFFQGTKV